MGFWVEHQQLQNRPQLSAITRLRGPGDEPLGKVHDFGRIRATRCLEFFLFENPLEKGVGDNAD